MTVFSWVNIYLKSVKFLFLLSIVKLEFTGVFIFLIFALYNIDCGYLLEPPQRGGSNDVPTIYVLSKNKKKYHIFTSKNIIHF